MKKINKKVIFKILIIFVISLFFASFEFVWSNRRVIRKNSSYTPKIIEKSTIKCEIDSEKNIEIDCLKYTIETNETNYVNKISFDYKTNKDFFWQINYKIENDELSILEKSSNLINRATKRVDITAKTFDIVIMDKEVEIDNVMVNNNIYFNWSRFIVVFTTSFSILLLLIYRKKFIKKLDLTYLLLSVVLGFLMFVSTSKVIEQCYDDTAHLKNSYSFISKKDFKANKAYLINESISLQINNEFTTQEEKKLLYKELNDSSHKIETISLNDYSLKYSKLIYFPYYVGLKVSQVLNLNYISSLLLARILNYIVYILIIYLAIKYSTKYKKLIFALGLTATRVFYGVSFTYDSLIIACLLLAFSVFMELIFSEKLDKKKLIIFIISVLFASLPKAIYAPYLLLALFIPSKKFDNKRQSVRFKICLVALTGILISTFILPIIFKTAGSGDIRGGDVSLYGQLSHIIHNPISFMIIIAKYLVYTIPNMVLGNFQFFGIGYLNTTLDNISGTLYLVYFITLLYIVFSNPVNRKDLPIKYKLLFILFVIMFFVGIPFTMYLVYTTVGAYEITGVQQRYFYQLLLPIFIILTPSFEIKKETKDDSFIVVIIPLLVFISIYIMVLNSVGL